MCVKKIIYFKTVPWLNMFQINQFFLRMKINLDNIILGNIFKIEEDIKH